jgi:hypothetical protein
VWLGNFLYIIIILNMLVITGMLELFFPNKLVHLVRKSEGGGDTATIWLKPAVIEKNLKS